MNTNNSAGEEFNDEGNVHGDGTTTEGDGKKSMASDLWSLVKPYKKEILANQILEHEPGDDRRAAIINCLRDMGVKVFIIEARSIETTGDILHHVHRVVDYVSRENQQFGAGYIDEEGNPVDPLGFQRCLLYQDRSGRLFNLMLSSHAVGPAGKFESLLTSFSGLEAMALVTVLCRTFACVAQGALWIATTSLTVIGNDKENHQLFDSAAHSVLFASLQMTTWKPWYQHGCHWLLVWSLRKRFRCHGWIHKCWCDPCLPSVPIHWHPSWMPTCFEKQQSSFWPRQVVPKTQIHVDGLPLLVLLWRASWHWPIWVHAHGILWVGDPCNIQALENHTWPFSWPF